MHPTTWRTRAWLAALSLLACGAPADPGPPGAWWAARGDAARALLAQLATLEGTPLGARAARMADALPDCERVGAHAPDGDASALPGALECLAPGSPLDLALRAADADAAFAFPVAGAPRLRGVVRTGADALEVAIDWPGADADGPLALLLPGDAPAGRDRLSGFGRLAHVHVRPDGGLDLGALVPAGSQADRLFRLKSELFTGAVLDGGWEASAYLPERPGAMPGVALALGFRVRRAAVAAAERFVADLQQTWPVEATPFALGSARGACLLELNVLPDLAPCWVATDDALVVGWNPPSLARALDPKHPPAPIDDDAAARAEIDLALLGHADARLVQSAVGADALAPPLRWPWRRLVLSAGADDGALAVRARLVLPQQARR